MLHLSLEAVQWKQQLAMKLCFESKKLKSCWDKEAAGEKRCAQRLSLYVSVMLFRQILLLFHHLYHLFAKIYVGSMKITEWAEVLWRTILRWEGEKSLCIREQMGSSCLIGYFTFLVFLTDAKLLWKVDGSPEPDTYRWELWDKIKVTKEMNSKAWVKITVSKSEPLEPFSPFRV